MRARRAIRLLSTLATIPLSIASAQVSSTGSAANEPRAVTVTFFVNDDGGNPVSDLRISALSVLDNGKPPLHIVSLGSAKELPLRLGILIDNNPFRGIYYSEKLPEYEHTPEWVLDSVDKMLTGPDDRAFIASYSTIRHGTTFVSRDQLRPIDLAKFLRTDAPVFLGTGDAVRAACHEVFGADPAGRERRILIVIEGSGEQAGRTLSRDSQILSAAQRAGVKVFSFGWLVSAPGNHPLKYHPGSGWLETGGWELSPQPDPPSWFEHIKSQIDSMYSLTYIPSGPYRAGELRRLDLKATNKSWHVHAPKRYLTPSAQ